MWHNLCYSFLLFSVSFYLSSFCLSLCNEWYNLFSFSRITFKKSFFWCIRLFANIKHISTSFPHTTKNYRRTTIITWTGNLDPCLHWQNNSKSMSTYFIVAPALPIIAPHTGLGTISLTWFALISWLLSFSPYSKT